MRFARAAQMALTAILLSIVFSAGHSAFAQDTTRPLIISEFRLNGTNGANDEFIEIYNNSDTDHVVTSTAGTGYALAASDGVTRFVIPIPRPLGARHYLAVTHRRPIAGQLPGWATTSGGPHRNLRATYTTNITKGEDPDGAAKPASAARGLRSLTLHSRRRISYWQIASMRSVQPKK